MWRKLFYAVVAILLVANLVVRWWADDGQAGLARRLPDVSPGWKLKVVAQSPRIRNPTAVCCAPDGRVFVGEDVMDGEGVTDRPVSRVACIHPGGRVEVFADQLFCVQGLAYLDGQLYVNHAPKFSVFTDDGARATQRRDLFDCTSPRADGTVLLGSRTHVPGNFRLGMDGFFYLAVGDAGLFNVRSRDGQTIQLHGGGVFRFRLDGSDMEVFASGTRNHPDVALNAEDELFTYDNTDDGNGWGTRLTHMVEGGTYGYPWDFKPRRPHTLWMISDFGGGAGAGAFCYNEDALPTEFGGDLFLADFSRQQIMRVTLGRAGASFVLATRHNDGGSDFVASRGLFLPVGLAVSPDGAAVYITDWNTGEVKTDKGRLIKLTYQGPSAAAARPPWWLPAALGKPIEASVSELLTGLRHPAQSVRLVAQRQLATQATAALPAVRALLADTNAPPFARWSAIWTLDAIHGGLDSRTNVIAALRDADASVRRQAARQLWVRRASEAVGPLVELLHDPDASVRFHAATALGRIADPTAIAPLQGALVEKDLFARYAAFTALNRVGRVHPDRWPEIALGLDAPESEIREGTIFALREVFETAVVAALAQCVVSTNASATVRVLALDAITLAARKSVAWDGGWWGANGHPSVQPRPARTLDWEGTPVCLARIRAALRDPDSSVRQTAARSTAWLRDAEAEAELAAALATESEPGTVVAQLEALAELGGDLARRAVADELVRLRHSGSIGATNDPPVFYAALEAAGRLGGPEIESALARFLDQPPNPSGLVEIIRHLGELKISGAVSGLAKRLDDPDAEIGQVVAVALGSIGGDAAAQALERRLAGAAGNLRREIIRSLGLLRATNAIPALLQTAKDEDVRAVATEALARMPDLRALRLFLDSVAHGDPRTRMVSRTALGALCRRDSAAVSRAADVAKLSRAERRVLNEIRAASSPAESHAVKALAGFALANPGDAELGARLFHDDPALACAKCHRAGRPGGRLGPDLARVGTKLSRQQLIDAVLFPSRWIAPGYEAVELRTQSGEVFTGLIARETPDTVTLLNAEGETAVPKTAIASRRRSSVSAMPEGLCASLSPVEFADLIAFLSSPH
ncbi:MAG: HEAT repeat domain-containing protein [Verrucomicrobia bacterium]|nr:HEAT repeat domain-containing protein [Verrucomicrobiota bacterium]